jgi:hypothetical protein
MIESGSFHLTRLSIIDAPKATAQKFTLTNRFKAPSLCVIATLPFVLFFEPSVTLFAALTKHHTRTQSASTRAQYCVRTLYFSNSAIAASLALDKLNPPSAFTAPATGDDCSCGLLNGLPRL